MATEKKANKGQSYVRSYRKAKQGEENLGPLKLLPGDWVGEGMGWNMIAHDM